MNKKISFKEELKRSLIVHALTPCFILCIICVLGFILIAFVNIYRNNNTYSLNSKEKLDSLNNELEMTKQSLGSIASRRSEINLAISDKYESYLGRDFLQAEKIEALQKLISDKEAANISDAIDLYQKRQMDKK
mgnify:CR=1 FL=1